MIDVSAAAHAITVRVTVVQTELGTQFVCGACPRIGEPRPLDITLMMLAGHLLSHLDPTWEGETD